MCRICVFFLPIPNAIKRLDIYYYAVVIVTNRSICNFLVTKKEVVKTSAFNVVLLVTIKTLSRDGIVLVTCHLQRRSH